MAEQIITDLILNIGPYKAQIDEAVKGMAGYDAATEEATKANKTFENSLGGSVNKLAAVKVAVDGVNKAEQGLVKTSAEVVAETNNIGKSFGQVEGQSQKIGGIAGLWNRVKTSVGAAGKTVTEFVKGSRDGVRDAVKGVGGLRGAFAQASGNVSKFFGGIASGAQSAVTQIPGVGQAFALLANPIVAATAAVGFLASNIVTRLDGASKTVDALKFSFDGVLNRLTSFEGFKGFFDPTQQLKDAAFAQAQAELLDEIDASQRKVNSSNAEAEKRLASLNQQLRDRTRSEEERISIASEITNIEVQRANKEEELLKKKLAGIDLEIAAAKSQGIAADQINDELLNRQNEAQVALVNAQTARISLTENVERRVNSITEQGANERAAQAAKEAAAREKADAKLKADTERRIALINELNAASAATEGPRQQEEQKATATRDDRIKRAEGDTQTLLKIEEVYQAELQGIRDKYAQQAEATADAQAKALQDAVLGSAEARLQRLESEQQAALQLAVQGGTDITELLKSQLDERTQLQEEISSIRLEQLTAQYEADYEALDGNLIAQYDRLAQFELDKAALLSESAAAEADAIQLQIETEEAAASARESIQSSVIDAAGLLGDVLIQQADGNKEAAGVALGLQKSAAIAQIIIQTAAAEQAALAAAALNPLVAAGGLAAIAAFAAPTIGALRLGAGISIATILSQVLAGFDGGGVVESTGGRVKASQGLRIPTKPGGDNLLATVKVNEVYLNERQRAKAESIHPGIFGEAGVPGFRKPAPRRADKVSTVITNVERSDNRTYGYDGASLFAPNETYIANYRNGYFTPDIQSHSRYMNSVANVNSYVEGSTTNIYNTTNTSASSWNDKRMVNAVRDGNGEVRRQTRLLEQLAKGPKRRNKRA